MKDAAKFYRSAISSPALRKGVTPFQIEGGVVTPAKNQLR